MASAMLSGLFNIFKGSGDNRGKIDPIPPQHVVAIDIGTFSSGYTVQCRSDYVSDPLRSYTATWTASRLSKTSTALLLGPDTSFQHFGHEADLRFETLEAEGLNPKKWYFFQHFKMMLYHHKDVADDTPVEATDGKHLSVLEVFSKSIEYMKDQALQYLSQSSGQPADLANIKWVLTVPVIWDDCIKQVMRRSAEKAGIPGDKLCMALEPECAALYCSQIPLDQLMGDPSKGSAGFAAIPGFTFMLVDMGGGTVDIATLRMTVRGTMEYVFKAGGGVWGGTSVNDRFQQTLRDLVGSDIMNEFAIDNRMEVHNMMMDFEQKKREFCFASDQLRHPPPFLIKLPTALMDLWEKKTGRSVDELVKGRPELNPDFPIANGKLSFRPAEIRRCIEQTVVQITDYVKREMQKPDHQKENIDLVILAGGFAESNFVVKKIRDEMKYFSIPVVRAPQPELAVMKGAVLYGHNEKIIVSRKLRYTYGVGMVMEYKKDVHDPDKKFEADGKVWARDVFRKHAVVGQEVRPMEWMAAKQYFPTDENQHSAQVFVFTSERENPIHTTEADCKCIGKIDIPLPQSGGGGGIPGKAKSLSVAMNFGGTEVEVRVTDNIRGKSIIQSLKPC